MVDARRMQALLTELRQRGTGDVLDEPEAVAAFSRDFGGMVERTPAAVFRPQSDDDVVAALRLAGESGVPVATRGTAHSQSGQGLGTGLVVDMRLLDRVLAVQPEEGCIEVEAGASWKKITDETFALGMLPCGLTHALDPTIGGTLSIAGVGAESFRCGPQVDNVLALDVATLAGEVVHCSPRENRLLFDAVRAGLGQCGVILRVWYPLRACRRFITTRYFAYRDVGCFLNDAVAVAEHATTGRWLASVVTRDPFASRRPILVLLVGDDDDLDDTAPPVPDMHHDFEPAPRRSPTWTRDGMPAHGFFHLFESASGERPTATEVNPWVEHVFSLEDAARALESLLADGGTALRHGKAGVIFLRRGSEPAPLFAVPDGTLLAGLGAFATFSASERAQAEGAMAEHEENMRRFSGKRYLSGYLAQTPPMDWAAHFGEAWDAFRAAKAAYDPHNLLNPDVIRWA